MKTIVWLTLSCLPKNCFQDERPNTPAPHECWRRPIGAVLSIKTDRSVLASIKAGYESDPFCVRLAKNNIPGARFVNGLWYVGDRLVIPRVKDLRENLYRLAHDSLGHFGADK